MLESSFSKPHENRTDSLVNHSLDALILKANELRATCIDISSRKKIPHLGSCLSCADILTVLFWDTMNLNTSNPLDPSRDRFLLSKGHASPIYLQALALRGFFDVSDLESFGANGSYFHEHPPKPGFINGVEAATGSLGHGFSMGLGMALSSKITNNSFNVFALLGDGECNEGVIWECALLAPTLKVDNFIGIIDYNKLQATGRSQEITSIHPLSKKWESFGWYVQEIDGHNICDIKLAFDNAMNQHARPSMIVANTVKGKGVSFMEDDNNWHYRTPNSVELDDALSELRSLDL